MMSSVVRIVCVEYTNSSLLRTPFWSGDFIIGGRGEAGYTCLGHWKYHSNKCV